MKETVRYVQGHYVAGVVNPLWRITEKVSDSGALQPSSETVFWNGNHWCFEPSIFFNLYPNDLWDFWSHDWHPAYAPSTDEINANYPGALSPRFTEDQQRTLQKLKPTSEASLAEITARLIHSDKKDPSGQLVVDRLKGAVQYILSASESNYPAGYVRDTLSEAVWLIGIFDLDPKGRWPALLPSDLFSIGINPTAVELATNFSRKAPFYAKRKRVRLSGYYERVGSQAEYRIIALADIASRYSPLTSTAHKKQLARILGYLNATAEERSRVNGFIESQNQK
jgi:hypothetical protein